MNKLNKDIKELAKGSGLGVISQFLKLIFRYFYTVILTNYLGVRFYGIFVLCRSILQFSGLVANSGTGIAIKKEIPILNKKKNPELLNQLISYVIYYNIISSTILAVLLYSFSDLIAVNIFHNSELIQPLKIFSFSLPAISLVSLMYEIFIGFKDIGRLVLIQNITFPIINIFLLVLVGILKLEFNYVITAFITTNYLVLLISHVLVKKAYKLKYSLNTYNKQLIKQILFFSIPVFFTSSLNFFQQWLDTFLLSLIDTIENVGIYNVAIRISAFVAMPLIASAMIFSPMISEQYHLGEFHRLKTNYQLTTKLILTLSLLIYGLIIIFSNEILFLFGNEFTNANIVLVILCSGQLVNAAAGNTGQFLVMTGRPSLHLYNTIIFLFITIGLNLYLIPLFGIIGAGITNVFALIVVNVTRSIQIYYHESIHPFKWNFLKPIFAFLLSLLIISIVKPVIPSSVYYNILLMTMFSVLYLTTMIIMRISEEEKSILLILYNKIISLK